MTIECLQCSLQLYGNTQRIEYRTLPTPLLWHFLADMLPEFAVHRHLTSRDVLSNGDTWKLHNATLDGIHQ